MNLIHFTETRAEREVDPLAGPSHADFDWDSLYQRMGEADETGMDDTGRLADLLHTLFDVTLHGVPLTPDMPGIVGNRFVQLASGLGFLRQAHAALHSTGSGKAQQRATPNPPQRKVDAPQGKPGGTASRKRDPSFLGSSFAGLGTLGVSRAIPEKIEVTQKIHNSSTLKSSDLTR